MTEPTCRTRASAFALRRRAVAVRGPAAATGGSTMLGRRCPVPSVAVLLATVAALAGCAGEPLRYHSLRDAATLAAPSRPAAPGPSGALQASTPTPAAELALHVVQVGMPAIVDRAELVLAAGNGSYRVLERQRWSASAAEEWRTALAARLVRQLGARDIDGLGPRADEPVLRVRVMVRRLDSVMGGDVRLEADWTVALSGPSPTPTVAPGRPLACSTRDGEAAGADVDAVVEATRRLVDRLAERIAAAATALRQGAPAC